MGAWGKGRRLRLLPHTSTEETRRASCGHDPTHGRGRAISQRAVRSFRVVVFAPLLDSPIGLILCSAKDEEQVELLQLSEGEIRVAEYLTALPDRALLRSKL